MFPKNQGVQFHIYGLRTIKDTSDFGTVKSVWDVDKGTGYGIVSDTTSVGTYPDGVLLKSTSLVLYCHPDVGISKGDKLTLPDGIEYYTEGGEASWRRYVKGNVHHLEIPLRATP